MATIADLLRRGLQHHQAGQLQEAERLYQHVLHTDPRQSDALHLLGVIACQTGQPQRAVELIELAIMLVPHSAAFHANLANAYQQLGRFADAEASCRQALRLQPGDADTCRKLGAALAAQDRLDDAAGAYQEALRLRPSFAEVHNDLGIVRRRQGRFVEAADSYRCALQLQPHLADAHNNLGNVLKRLGRLDEAVAACRDALRLRPDFAAAHNNLGNALADQGRIEEATAGYQSALHYQPMFPVAHSNLLLCFNYTADFDAVTAFTEHRRWGERYEEWVGPPAPHDNDPVPERILRVGYVAPELGSHPTAFFMEPIFTHHDRRAVEVYCYLENVGADAATARLLSLVHGWRATSGMSDERLAGQIRSDRIDLLVDLAGHTADNRLLVFARKPAPVQLTYFGNPNTTGLRRIDYRVTDAIMDPPGSEAYNAEALIRLLHGMHCYAPPPDAPPLMPLPARASGRVTFGSVHRLSKLNDAVLDLWCRLLDAVPDSRLLVYRNTLVGQVREELARRFAQRGISADRLDLRHSTAGGHRAAFGDMDISLDTFPYAGCTITCEALWQGVPVLTLRGDRPAGRAGAALLSYLGLPEWIAQTPDQYVALAVRFAGGLDRLVELRATLRDRMRATFCDGAAFTRDLEDAYRLVWRKWCAAQR
jgi:predicted O-linked N-acetylglucosamine transferase (SPINDLY family)